MPGKVNPVICESVIQVACRVIGNDMTVTTAGLGGIGSLFELNVAMPVMIDAFLESVKLLANSSNVFVDKLLTGLELIDQSLMMVTSLAPLVGYEQSATLAKDAFKLNTTIRQLCLDRKILPAEELDKALDPMSMTHPSV
jgi:fumarate hydratase class II